MNMRTKSTSISQNTKKVVHNRDGGCCIFCGRPIPISMSNAHIIPRSAGGLGIEQNIISACFDCHRSLDQSTKRTEMMWLVEAYMMTKYAEWDKNKYIFKKGVTK